MNISLGAVAHYTSRWAVVGSVAAPFLARGASLAVSTGLSIAVMGYHARTLSALEYAAAGLILGLSLFHPILEAGTTPVFVNETAALHGRRACRKDDRSPERARMRAALRVLLLILVGVMVVAGIASIGSWWPALLAIREAPHGLGWAAFATAVALSVNVFAGAGGAVLAGAGKQWVVSLLPAATSLLSLMLVTLIPWPATAGVLPAIAVPMSGAIVSLSTLIWVKVRLGLPFRAARELWDRKAYPGARVGSLMVPALAVTVFSVVFFAADRYLIMRAGGEADLPLFVGVSQVYMALIALLVAASNGLWAWTQQAKARGEGPGPIFAWRVAGGFLMIGSALAAVLYTVTPFIVPIILGRPAPEWHNLTLALCLLLAVYGPLIGLESLLKERRGFRIRALAWPLALATKLVLAALLVQAWGSPGIVMSGTLALIPLIAIELWAAIRLSRRRAIDRSLAAAPEDSLSHAAPARRVLVARLRWDHHAGSSGYDRISHYLAPCECIDFQPPPAMSGLNRFAALSRFDLRIRMRSKGLWMTHVLYADSQAILAPGARSGSRYVGTLHLPISPPGRARSSLKDRAIAARRRSVLGNFAGLIVLASSEVGLVQEAYPASRVQFIPHGVEIPQGQDLRSPVSQPPDGFRIAVVGANYRNWDELDAILRIIARSRPRWTVHLVGVPRAQQTRFTAGETVVIEPRLDDPAYYGLIAHCDAMLLPLTFATANNALLEAHALGTPSVCSDLAGIRDYGLSTTRLFTGPSEAIDHLDQLSNTCESDRRALRMTTRTESARFGWPAIAERTRAFYRTVGSM